MWRGGLMDVERRVNDVEGRVKDVEGRADGCGGEG